MDEKNTLVERQETVPTIQQDTRLNPLVAAVLGGADVDLDKMEKMMAMQERYEALEAKKAYNAAMSSFRGEAPVIGRDSHVSYGNTDYKHSTLGSALKEINPLLAKYGLNPSWRTSQDTGQITVTCTITHAQGHSESTSLSSAPDASGGKNSIQAIGSAVSYLERYTLFSICGLASGDQDDDGHGEDLQKITEEQAMQIHALIDENGLNKDKFIAWIKRSVKSDSIEEINTNGFDTVMTQINRAIKKNQEQK